VLSLALNLLLIPIWDIIGSAIATLLSQLIYWLACYYFSQRVFYVPYEIRKIATLFFTGVALSFSGLFFNHMDLLPRLLFKAVCVLSFPFVLHLFRFYEPRELQAIRGFFAKWGKLRNFRKNISSLRGLTDEL
jgi:O-antigen/teichoic acid export membrane protein